MKKQQINKISLYKKLIKEGFNLSTLLNFNDNQLLQLSSRVLLEQEDEEGEYKVTELGDDEAVEVEDGRVYKKNNKTYISTKISENEDEDVIPTDKMGNPTVYIDRNGNVDQLLRDRQEILDEIEYGGMAPMDTASFDNPDAAGFQSQGPMDSYNRYGDYESFVGLNEYVTEPQASFPNPRKGPYDSGRGLYEDININVADKSADPDYTDDGMGIFENESELDEKFASKAQQGYFFARCGECKRKDCKWCKMAKEFADDTKDFENLPKKVKKEMTESWIMSLVERYERPSMSKLDFLTFLNEQEVKTVVDPDIEDASEELPSWMDFESIFMNQPMTKPRPTTKPTTRPSKPGRKSPYKPKHKPTPKARK